MNKSEHEIPCFGKKLTISVPQTLSLNGVIYDVVAVDPHRFETVQVTPTEPPDFIGPRNKDVGSESESIKVPVLIGIQYSNPEAPQTVEIPMTELIATAIQKGSKTVRQPS